MTRDVAVVHRDLSAHLERADQFLDFADNVTRGYVFWAVPVEGASLA